MNRVAGLAGVRRARVFQNTILSNPLVFGPALPGRYQST